MGSHHWGPVQNCMEAQLAIVSATRAGTIGVCSHLLMRDGPSGSIAVVLVKTQVRVESALQPGARSEVRQRF